MRKNEPIDFSIPTRQSYTAIVLIMYKLYKSVGKQFGFVLIFFVIGGPSKKIGFLTYVLAALAIFVSIYSIIAFFKYYFFIKGDKLIVHRGVFKKINLEIPFDRIQSINYEQNVLHRLFGVVKLDMDTAGSSIDEVQLHALDKDIAKALRGHILSNKQSVATVEGESETIQEQKTQTIFKLSFLQLLKVGITANHIRSGGLIIIFFLYMYENLEDVGLDVVNWLEQYTPMAEAMFKSFFFILFFVTVFFVASFIFSMIRTVLKYFNLTMDRMGDGFVVESGLLSRKQFAAKDTKIQTLRWSQNLLQQFAKIYLIVFQQASSVEVSTKKSLVVAGLDSENIDQTLSYVFKQKKSELNDIEWKGVDVYFLVKKIYRWTILCLILLSALYFLDERSWYLYVFAFYLFGLLNAYLKFKKKKYGLSKNILGVQGGTFGNWTAAMEQFKVQSISILSTPFQRRRGLASITINTASNTLRIPDIDKNEAEMMKDYFLYKIETSKEEWM